MRNILRKVARPLARLCRKRSGLFLQVWKHAVRLRTVVFLSFIVLVIVYHKTLVELKESVSMAIYPLCHTEDGSELVKNLSCPLVLGNSSAPVVLTFATVGWYKVLLNWLCSLQSTGTQGYVIIVSMDWKLCGTLNDTIWGSSSVICFEALKYPMYRDTKMALASSFHWGSKAYRRIILFRTQVIYSMLLCSRNMLLSDVDVVFLRDPFPNLYRLMKTRGLERLPPSKRYDMLFQRGAMGFKILDYFHDFTVFGKWYICAGFVFMAPTSNTLQFWRTLMRYQESDWNDQAGMNKCLILSRLKIRWKVLPYWKYLNGHDILSKNMPESTLNFPRNNLQSLNASGTIQHYIVHFNWLYSISNKIATMKHCNVWHVNCTESYTWGSTCVCQKHGH